MRAFEPLHPNLRIAALSVCSVGSITRGLAYVGQQSTGGLTTFVDAVVPLPVWAIIWMLSGLAILAGIWHRVIARWALSFGASLWAVWGLSFLWAAISGDSARGWVTASTMFTLAGVMVIIAALADSVGPPEDPVIPPRGDDV